MVTGWARRRVSADVLYSPTEKRPSFRAFIRITLPDPDPGLCCPCCPQEVGSSVPPHTSFSLDFIPTGVYELVGCAGVPSSGPSYSTEEVLRVERKMELKAQLAGIQCKRALSQTSYN